MADARLDADERRTSRAVCGGLGIPAGSIVSGDGPGGYRRRLPDSRVFRWVHGARRRLLPFLRLYESVHVCDADSGPGKQFAAHVRWLGRRRSMQLPADRILFPEEVGVG